jgi:outer membrane protein OmpA-like peptidoglycan-associated protein
MKLSLTSVAVLFSITMGGTATFAQQGQQLPLNADTCAIMSALALALPSSCTTQSANGQSRGIVVRLNKTLKKTTSPVTALPRVASIAKPTAQPTAKAQTPAFDRAAAKSESGYYIQFAFDSDQLEQDYQAHLDRLSEVLKGEAMLGTCLRVSGHTDTAGSDTYNKRLSEKRAIMVASYLHSSGGIAAERIAISAEGEARPLPDVHGLDPLNRRVEFQTKESNNGCL